MYAVCYGKDRENRKNEMCFIYFRNMKRVVFALSVFLLAAGTLSAQVIVRNDFVINRKARRLENKGITFISFNLDAYPNWNQLLNGRGGRTMVIDVHAIRHPKQVYSYEEIAEKIYTAEQITGPMVNRVPLFLTWAPPVVKKIPAPRLRRQVM